MRKIQIWIHVVWVGLVLSWSGVAVAEDGSTLLVPMFQGSKPQGLRDLAVELLIADGFDVVELEVTPTLTAKAANTAVSSAARRHHARAVVIASTELSKREWESVFSVRDGETGKTLGKFEIAAATFPGLQKAYRNELVDQLLPLLEQASGGGTPVAPVAKESEPKATPKPASPSQSKKSVKVEPEPAAPEEEARASETEEESEPEPEEPEAEESEPEPEKEPSDAASDDDEGKKAEALAIYVGPAFMMRSWTIHDPLTDANDGPLLAGHSAPGFGLHAALRLYPAAFADQPIVRHIGLLVDFSRTLASKTEVENVTNDSDDATRNTTIQSFLVGLHVRIPVGPLYLGVLGAYGIDSLTLEGEKERVAVPDVSASFVRAALNADWDITSSTRIGLAGGYRIALGFGKADGQLQSAAWFPDTVGGAIDGRLEVRQMFTPMFGVSLGGGLTRYILDFSVGPDHVEAADDADLPAPPIAGGATDTYTSLDLNAVVVF